MKLSDYAKKHGVTYKTAYNHWQKGLIKGYQLPTGTIVVEEEKTFPAKSNRAVLYARVSSSENKKNLDPQLNRLRDYASAKGYLVVREVKETGSGLNDKRPLLEKILKKDDWDILVSEHKDRLARFGLNYLEILLNKQQKTIEIINQAESDRDDLMQDFISIITSFCARLYGPGKSKRKTETVIKALSKEK